MKKLLLLLTFTLSGLVVSAQQTTFVTGKVTDRDNVGMPGVTVFVKGTQQGTITNIDGEYEISAPADGTLVYSYIGYRTEEIEIGAQTIINIQLTETSFDMDEVVVIGYGSAAVKDLTGNIAVVKADQLTNLAVPNIANALQGKVAGVQISTNGAPGSSPTIRIRGLGTVSSNASPVYVVDGVFVDDINFLSPQQIESVTILKDASSAAIYGIRAANGVIIVTTKKGTTKKSNLVYSGYVGLQKVSNLLETANTDQYLTLVNEKITVGESRGTASTLFDPNAYPDYTNWYNEILQTANIQNHNINISGGSENADYFLGVGITKQEGLVKKNDYTKVNLRGSSNIRINKWIKAGYGITLNGSKTNNPAGVLRAAYVTPPAFKPMVDATTYSDPVLLGFGNFTNPTATLDFFNNVSQHMSALTNIYTELTPVKGLTLKSSFSVDGKYSQNRSYTPEYWVSVAQNDTISKLNKSNSQNFNYSFDNTATYNGEVGDHRFTVMGGLSNYSWRYHSLNGFNYDVPYFSEASLYLNNGTVGTSTSGDGGSLARSTSYFGRMFYSFKNRYLLTATVRRDGSSTFPKDERWGTFPSLGLGWIVSQEDFFSDVTLIDFLKVRASWGMLGNNQIPQNAYTVTVDNWGGYSVVYGPYGSSAISQGASITSIVEPQLKWEIVEEYDIGIEALLMNNRLKVEFDLYNRLTHNAIFPVTVIGTSGMSGRYLDNNADILNRGIELVLDWNNKITEKINYRVGGNFSFNHNEVYKLQEGTIPFYAGDAVNGALATFTQQGHPIGEFYVLEIEGIFQDFDEVNNYVDAEGTVIMPNAVPGDFKYTDQNEDGVIDERDRIPYGSYTPKVLYAFNFGLTYGSFDFSLELQGVAGNKIYNVKRISRYGNENYDLDFAENRWHGAGTSNTYPSADIAGGKNAYPNTFFVESGAYFRVRNVQLGYTLPQSLTNRISSSNFRIYVSAQNPLTLFGYNGFSPEVPGNDPSSGGMDYGVYPLSSVTSVGLTVNF